MPTADHVLVRTACGEQIGLGHYRRCLTLAEALIARGARVTMLVASDDRARSLLVETEIPTRSLSPFPDEPHDTLAVARAIGATCLIIDDYAVTSAMLREWSAAELVVGVIDDLAERTLEVDLVINGSPHAHALPYRFATYTERLLGPRFALLRAEFRELAPPAPAETVQRVLVMMGGSDPLGLTDRAVAAVRIALPTAHIDAVVGPLASSSVVAGPQVTLHVAPPELPALMQRAELAVSAAGQSLYELAACGVPTLAIAVADNQRAQLAALAEAGVVWPVAVSLSDLSARVTALANDSEQRERMRTAGRALVDGDGALRAADAIILKARSTHGW